MGTACLKATVFRLLKIASLAGALVQALACEARAEYLRKMSIEGTLLVGNRSILACVDLY